MHSTVVKSAQIVSVTAISLESPGVSECLQCDKTSFGGCALRFASLTRTVPGSNSSNRTLR